MFEPHQIDLGYNFWQIRSTWKEYMATSIWRMLMKNLQVDPPSVVDGVEICARLDPPNP